MILKRWLFGGLPLPVVAHVDADVPVSLGEPLHIPIEQRLVITFNDVVDIEAEIPIRTHVDLDTIIETEVLRIGRVKLPISTRLKTGVSLDLKS